jgi:hypothetical protein
VARPGLVSLGDDQVDMILEVNFAHAWSPPLTLCIVDPTD